MDISCFPYEVRYEGFVYSMIRRYELDESTHSRIYCCFYFAYVNGNFVRAFFRFRSVVGKLSFPEVVYLAELADSFLCTQWVLAFIVQIFVPQITCEHQITVEITKGIEDIENDLSLEFRTTNFLEFAEEQVGTDAHTGKSLDCLRCDDRRPTFTDFPTAERFHQLLGCGADDSRPADVSCLSRELGIEPRHGDQVSMVLQDVAIQRN